MPDSFLLVEIHEGLARRVMINAGDGPFGEAVQNCLVDLELDVVTPDG